MPAKIIKEENDLSRYDLVWDEGIIEIETSTGETMTIVNRKQKWSCS